MDGKQNKSNFVETVSAVICGMFLYEHLKGLAAFFPRYDSYTSWIVTIALIIVVVIGSFIFASIQHWQQKRRWDRDYQEAARKHGYESWAEYMEAESTVDTVRESWKELASKERAKRARRGP